MISRISFPEEAARAEREHDWIKAAQVYSNMLKDSNLGELYSIFELGEKIGSCYIRAACQALSPDQFRERVSLAKLSYEEVSQISDRKREEGKYSNASAAYFDSRASLLRAWLAPDRESRTGFLYDSMRLAENALSLYADRKDVYHAVKCSNQILQSLSEIIVSEPSSKICRELVLKGLEVGRKNIEDHLQSSSDLNENDLCRTYYITSWISSLGQNLYDSEEMRKELSELTKVYWQKSQLIISDLKDQTIEEESRCYGWRQDVSDSPEGIVKTTLDQIKRLLPFDDNLQIACEYGNLVYGLRWLMVKEEDPRRLVALLGDLERHFGEMMQRYELSSPVGIRCDIPAHCSAVLLSAYLQCAELQVGSEEREKLLDKALKVGVTAFDRFKESTTRVRHISSKLGTIFEERAKLKTDLKDRERLLSEALVYSKAGCTTQEDLEPYDYWATGTALLDLASIQYELAFFQTNEKERIRQISRARETSVRGAELLGKTNLSVLGTSASIPVASRLGKQSRMSRTLYELSGEKTALESQLRVLRAAEQIYELANFSSRLAETFWEMGRAHSLASDHVSSADCYKKASEHYRNAAEKFPQIRDYYMDYSQYMESWSHIEFAKQRHLDEDYEAAKSEYEQAFATLSKTNRWLNESSFYKACARLEEAESIIQRAGTELLAIKILHDSADLFDRSYVGFGEAKKSPAEKRFEDAQAFARAAQIKKDYSETRIMLEEARLAYREGRLAECERHYSGATFALEKLASGRDQFGKEGREDIVALALSCNAWQKLVEGEIQSSPKLFDEASQLFTKAQQTSRKQRMASVFRGNAKYSDALCAGLRFRDTCRMEEYMLAKSCLLEASESYSKAGLPNTMEWSTAAERTLDAFVNSMNAAREVDPERKRRYYQAAENLLEISASAYEKTGYLRKRDETISLLNKIEKEKSLSLSLEKLLVSPTIPSGAFAISIDTTTGEQPAGLVEFETANVQIAPNFPDEIRAGEDFLITLDLINTGKEVAILYKLEGLLPNGLSLSESERAKLSNEVNEMKKSTGVGEDGIWDFGGKRLPPLKLESITISAVASGGVERVNYNPKIAYSDKNGVLHTKFLGKSLQLLVQPALEFKFKSEKTTLAFKFLVDSFVKDYMIEKAEPEKSGWRTASSIGNAIGLSGANMYVGRRPGGLPRFLDELVKRGLVETRVFRGERGRGGEVTRARIAYERDAIRLFINEKVRKKP